MEGEAGVGKSRFLLEFARRVKNDALVLPVDIHESLRPSVMALTQTLKSAARRMTGEELRLTLGAAPALGSVSRSTNPEADILAEGAEWVAALSAKAPVVLLIDDLDRAGPTLLHLIGHLSAIETSKRVLVVASSRSPIAANAPLVDRLVVALERRGRVDRLMLRGLDEPDIDDLLRRMRIGPHDAIVARLHDLTGGNAFLLAELLSTGQPERVVEAWATSPRIRDVVLARVDELGRAASEVLRVAAVFEREFSIPLLCAPILPVLTYKSFDEVAPFIAARDKPLALYVFGEDRARVDSVIDATTAGGTCVNNTVIHFANPNLPFGGVGPSRPRRLWRVRIPRAFARTRRPPGKAESIC